MGTINPDDGDLWSHSLEGDGDAFGVLLDRHSNRVYRHAYRLAQNRPDGEDTSAAAFLELWRQRPKVTLVQGSVLPWLLVTTTKCALNLRRATRRYDALLKRLPRTPETEDAAATYLQSNPLDDAEAHLARALRTLKTVDLQLITLIALEGYGLEAAMNLEQMDPTFSQGLRTTWVEQVNAASPTRRRQHGWWVGAGVFAGVGLVGGVGAATAGVAPSPERTSLPPSMIL